MVSKIAKNKGENMRNFAIKMKKYILKYFHIHLGSGYIPERIITSLLCI